jgi:hypothetical protein
MISGVRLWLLNLRLYRTMAPGPLCLNHLARTSLDVNGVSVSRRMQMGLLTSLKLAWLLEGLLKNMVLITLKLLA